MKSPNEITHLEHDSIAPPPAGLEALRGECLPQTDLWPGIAAAIQARREHTSIAEGAAVASELAALRKEHLPAHDLWPGIEAAIHARRARAWRMPLWGGAALAASLVMVLGLSVLHGERRGKPLQAPPAVAAAQLAEAHAAAIRDVVNRPLHGETRALVRANLKIVNNAEEQLKRALAEDPDGEYLKSLLASARSQQTQLAALEDRH